LKTFGSIISKGQSDAYKNAKGNNERTWGDPLDRPPVKVYMAKNGVRKWDVVSRCEFERIAFVKSLIRVINMMCG